MHSAGTQDSAGAGAYRCSLLPEWLSSWVVCVICFPYGAVRRLVGARLGKKHQVVPGQLHPRNLTGNPKMKVWKMNFLGQRGDSHMLIFGCVSPTKSPWQSLLTAEPSPQCLWTASGPW